MAITGLIADKNMNPITDPDPIDVVEDLKNLDDNTLAKYAQDRANPNATYALVVLMQRKKARDTAQEQAPTSTVAQEVAQDVTTGGLAQLQPQMVSQGPQGQGVTTPPPNPQQLTSMGVGSLPAPNVGQNYAGGGIVAFQEGGDVGSTLQSRLFGGIGLGNSVRSKGKGYPLEYYDDGSDFVPGANSFKRTNLGLVNLSEEDLAKLSEQDRNLYLQAKDLERRQKNKMLIQELQGDKKDMVKAIEEKQEEAKAKAEEEGAILATEDKPQPQPEPTIDTADMTMPETKPTSSYLDQLKEQYKQAGVNENYFKEERDMLEAEKQLRGAELESAKNVGLIRAGLATAAGTSQNFLENVSKGLGIGFEGYIQDKKEIDREQKEFDKLMRVNRAAEQADAKGDVREAVKMKQEADKLANDLIKNRLSNQTSLKVAQIGAAKKGDYEKFRDFVSKDKSFMVKDATTGEMRLDEAKVKKAFDGYSSQEATLLGKLYSALPTIVDPLEREETLRNIRTLEARIIGTGGGADRRFSIRSVK